MIKGLKFIFVLLLFLPMARMAKAVDFIPIDTIYVIVADSSQYTSVQMNKEWPQFIKIGKHQLKNPIYSIAIDVVGKDKATAVVLTLLTGPLGGHRLYLGTKPIVPIVYICTLGGGIGVLPFIDLVVICFSKDISRFENNDKIFMWVK